MKTYQYSETGKLHVFDDRIEPTRLDNRNIPTTLSEIVIPQPSEPMFGSTVSGLKILMLQVVIPNQGAFNWSMQHYLI